jgi:hypothetical protein
MIKALCIGLGLALSVSVVSAKPKKTRTHKRPAHPPAASHTKTPDSNADTQPPIPPPDTPSDAKLPTATDPSPPAAEANGNPADGKRSGVMKTDEKAGPNEALQKSASEADYRNVSQDDEEAALIAFRQGNTQLNDGFFVKAAQHYRQALSHWNHPAIHYNLALALINLDQPIEVFHELNKAMAYGAEPLGDKEKFDRAKGYLKLVEGQLADIEVSCDKIGAKVAVDGKEVFIAPGKFAQKVRVGKHTFHADKQGYIARITAPYIGPGEKFRIELKVYTAQELTRYRRKWQNTWFPYAVLGAGAVVGLAAGGLELSAQSSYDQFNTAVAKCNTMSAGCPISTPGITSLRDSGDTKRVIGYVGYGIAGAAVATGAVLLWINRQQPYQIGAEELNATPAPIAIAPIVSPEMAGAMVQGHF